MGFAVREQGTERRAVFGRQITRAVSWKFLPSWKCFPAVLSERAAPYIVLVWLRTEFFILLNFNKFNWLQGLVATLFWGGHGLITPWPGRPGDKDWGAVTVESDRKVCFEKRGAACRGHSLGDTGV